MPPQSATFDAAVDVLMEQGFSRLAAMQIAEEAMGEVRAKQRASAITERILATPYQAWLRGASPEYIWDKPVHAELCRNIDDIIAGRARLAHELRGDCSARRVGRQAGGRRGPTAHDEAARVVGGVFVDREGAERVTITGT
jgi:hypothetical protein